MAERRRARFPLGEARSPFVRATLALVSRPAAIPWEGIRHALARNPDGLTSLQIAAIAAPAPGDRRTAPAVLCRAMLLRREALGHVRRAGRAAPGRDPGPPAVIWQLPPDHARLALKREMALARRRLDLLRREIAAIDKIMEGIEELEQADREIAARGPLPRLCR